jgi:trigger factor
MQTTLESLVGNKVKLTVEVDEEDVKRAEEDTLRRLTRQAQLPGFRPGKVPRQVLVSRLGHKTIRAEVLNDVLPRYYEDAVTEQSLDVINQPEIDITSGEESGPIVFAATVEVRPEVTIAGYNGLEITVPSPLASDADIDAQIDRMREQFATLNEVDRPARDGDVVTLNIHGTRDGELAEGLTADDLVYQVGSGGIVEGIDEKLFNAKVGDEFELDAQDAPGGPAHLEVKVTLVREKLLPDADDAFATDASEFENLAQLREDLRDRLSSVKRMQASSAMQERAIEALVGLVDVEVPEILLNDEKQHLLQDLAFRLSQQQVSIQDYLNATGQDPDTFLSELDPQAITQVKADLALRALVREETLEADESDVDEEIVRLAAQSSQSPAEMRSFLEQNSRMPALRSQIERAKAMKWLIENVSMVNEDGGEVDRDELMAILEEHEHDQDHVHDHDHDSHDHDAEEA